MLPMETLQYPIGKFESKPFSEKLFTEWLLDIKYLPHHLENAILNLDEAQLDTPYRPQGWTVKQLVHHMADSHMNAFIRCKLALTEELPTIKPYDEVAWALTPEINIVPINVSITLLHALHHRWHALIGQLSQEDLQRKFFHPEHQKEISLLEIINFYAWHSKHHVAHITSLRERNNW